MHEESQYAERAVRAGAMGYVMKQDPPENVVAALRKILKGEVSVGEKVTTRLLQKLSRTELNVQGSELERLSDRELEVLQLLGQGFTSRRIAERWSRSVKTIDTYRENIKKKLNFKNSAELVHYAVQWAQGKKFPKTS